MIKIILLALALTIPIQSQAITLPDNHSSSATKLFSVDDLKDKRIGVVMGSADESYATKNYPQATILQYKSPADVILAVKTSKVDAALYDAEPLRNIIQQDNSLEVLGDSLFSFDVGVGFNKNNNRLKDRFNKFLAKSKSDGTYKDMVDRWMVRSEINIPQIKSDNVNGDLVVGVSDVGLPFTFVKDNQLVGFDIELVKRFAASEGKEIKFSNMDFGSLISAVSSGKVDMIASSIYVTEERKKQIDFSDAYYQMGTRVFALKSNITTFISEEKKVTPAISNKLINSSEDIKNKKIGVLLGSTHDVYAHKHFPDAEIMQYKSLSDLLLAVKLEKVDVAIFAKELLIEILKKDKDLGLIGNTFEPLPVGYAFNKKNTELRDQYNKFFAGLKENGTYNEMVDRWIKKGEIKMPLINTPNKNGVLVVGHVSDAGLPFASIKDNQLIGFNIELTKRFAAYLGKEVRFDDMEFGSLIPALAAGKVDMIGMTLNITEERKTKVDFGDQFYEISMQFFGLKKNIGAYSLEKKDVLKVPAFWSGVVDSFQSNIIDEKRYLLLWDGFKTTVVISILATLFGTLLGSIICFLRMSKNNLLNIPAKVYISILRGTPVLVILMIIFYVVFGSVNINPIIVATIAFGMNFGAYAAEIFRSGIEGIDNGQMEAGIAMGFNKLKTFIYIILPQTVRRILPIYKGEFISLVKMTSIVGYIAVQDLTKASDIIRSRTFDAFFPLIMIAILYFLISWVLMQVLDYLEKITDPKYKRQLRSKS